MTSPVLVIHGTEDEVIDFSHGLAIYERCPRAVEPLWVEVFSVYILFICIHLKSNDMKRLLVEHFIYQWK